MWALVLRTIFPAVKAEKAERGRTYNTNSVYPRIQVILPPTCTLS